MKKVLIVLVAALLCGATFAIEKNLQDVNQRIAPPNFRTLDGTWCSTPNAPIPDGDAGSVVDVLNIPASEIISGNLSVSLQIQHTWTGDLRADLTNGACTIQLMRRIGVFGDVCCGCSGDDVDVIFLDGAAGGPIEDACGTGASGGAGGEFTPGDYTCDGSDPGCIWPTAMADCDGQDVNGDWTLTVSDGANLDTGTLLQWCMITGTGGGDGGGDGGGTVPATSTTGLIILAVLLMIGGSLFVMRRRNA